MNVSEFTYDLPESAIAIHPPAVRGASRLLVLNKQTGSAQDDYYKNLAHYLRPGDVLILNNTKVLPARLMAKTEEGKDRELLLLEKHGDQTDEFTALALFRGKLRASQVLRVGVTEVCVEAVYPNGTAKITSQKKLWDLAEQRGQVPLPPYMHRDEEPADRERYQTVFAKEKGSVAAPTASLNLTQEILDSVRAKGVKIAEVTLHVGLGTFMPIRTQQLEQHAMHKEYFVIPETTVRAIQEAKMLGGRVIAAGTTVVRTLEFAQDKLKQAPKTIHGEADIFIYPGYEFKVVDAMLTNFHAPESTVLMMAGAFAGWDHLKQAYEHAIKSSYKFLSYGDSMFIG